jgi:hypothetical protein
MSGPYEGDSPTATTPGLTGKNTAVGSGDGVFGQGFNGVHGEGNSSGSGVWGHSTGFGAGVFGQGFNGLHGESATSPPGSGVWGNNTGSGHGVSGQSAQGDGVFGQGQTGVHGASNDPTLTGVGVLGEHLSAGMGVKGTSASGDGVFGQGQPGVHGASNDPTFRGVGVLGEHPSAGIGVKGTSVSGFGVEAISESGAAISAVSTTGAGISAISSAGTGVQGVSRPPLLDPGPITGDGVVGIGKNGVRGESSSPTDSGVWGDNLSSGYGVSGSSTHGNGVIGLAAGAAPGGGTANGVIGRTTNGSASGVWGENTGAGYGVTGQSASGIGIYGQGKPAGQFDGNVIINGGNLTMQNGGDVILGDFAEDFDVVEAGVGSGTVMVLGDDEGLRPCDLPYDKRVAGVVSGAGNFRPGIVLGKQRSKDNTLPIALVGKVYCKVDADHSPIQVGDLLTTSDIQGHAMKARNQRKAFGAVIGKALGSLKKGRGLIPILIALQ